MNKIVHIIEQSKMKPDDVKNETYIDSNKEVNDKDPQNSKLVIM